VVILPADHDNKWWRKDKKLSDTTCKNTLIVLLCWVTLILIEHCLILRTC
jgi:hypothetical protein